MTSMRLITIKYFNRLTAPVLLSIVYGPDTIFYLNNHVIKDEKEVDGFRSHDEDVKTTGRLVETNGL